MHGGKEALKCNETSNIHFINLVFREFSDVIMVYKCSDIAVQHVNIFCLSGHFYPAEEGDYQELRLLWCILITVITHSGRAPVPKALLQAFIDTELAKRCCIRH